MTKTLKTRTRTKALKMMKVTKALKMRLQRWNRRPQRWTLPWPRDPRAGIGRGPRLPIPCSRLDARARRWMRWARRWMRSSARSRVGTRGTDPGPARPGIVAASRPIRSLRAPATWAGRRRRKEKAAPAPSWTRPRRRTTRTTGRAACVRLPDAHQPGVRRRRRLQPRAARARGSRPARPRRGHPRPAGRGRAGSRAGGRGAAVAGRCGGAGGGRSRRLQTRRRTRCPRRPARRRRRRAPRRSGRSRRRPRRCRPHSRWSRAGARR